MCDLIMHWIIGDIHGMLAPLLTLLAEIERRDPERQLIFAGDYVNRGPDSKQVIDLLLTLQRARFLRGNHDDVFDQVLHDASYCGKPGEYDRIAAFRWFMNFGLFQTFRSYGVSERQLVSADSHPSARALSELGEFVPAAHHDFLRRLETVVEHEEFFVAHAKWPVGVSSVAPSMSEQLEKSPELRQTIVWGRFAEFELMAEKKWERRGYFGHTPVY